MSYVNMILYSAVLPSYKSKKDKANSEQNQETIKVDDPNNRDMVKRILEQFD